MAATRMNPIYFIYLINENSPDEMEDGGQVQMIRINLALVAV
jgi:hypothetical protein